MSFFRQLLGDRNPAVAFHASRFLIDELQAERPEQYTAIHNALLNKVCVMLCFCARVWCKVCGVIFVKATLNRSELSTCACTFSFCILTISFIIIFQAQQTNDEQLLSNPYLQIHEMIRGFAQNEDDKNKAAPARTKDVKK